MGHHLGHHSAATIAEAPPREFQRDNLVLRINVTIPADPNAISPVVGGIMEMARWMDCIEGKETELETSLREALANAITHGCHGDPSKKVQCCVACDEDHSLLILVRDPGSGFDPKALPDPTLGENLLSAHGRGIYLINELMDEVRFERGGSQIFMRKQ
ncbi:MAG: ATP-binding protein [Terriglobales bacterium]